VWIPYRYSTILGDMYPRHLSMQWTHPVFAPDAISSSVTGTRYDAAAMRSRATISVATCFICSVLGSVVGLIEALLSRTSVLFHGLLAVVLLTRNRSYYLFGLRKVKLMLLIISLISLQSYLLFYLLLLVFHHPLTLSLYRLKSFLFCKSSLP